MNSFGLKFYHDPSHGWLRVSKEAFPQVNSSISSFSYQDKNFYYLEEDLDATTFIKEARKKGFVIDLEAIPNEYISSVHESQNKIRRLNRVV